jgi:mono/diheme cytochrome c family protein
VAPAFSADDLTEEPRENWLTNGGGGMPAFRDQLTEKQIRDVAAFVTERVATG